MASSRQRERELARRRYLRQAQRRAEQARRRRKRITFGVAGTLAVVVVAVVLGVLFIGKSSPSTIAAANPSATPSASASATPSASTSPTGDPSTRVLACYQKAPPTAAPAQKFSAEPPLTVDTTKTYTMVIDTTCGIITAALDVKDAPHTVNSFAFLASKSFFKGDECHRVTNSATLTVLQCGDPTATGSGGPGYSFKDENLTGATYPRGTLAMANSGANTNGSQFFLVDKDSQLSPNYTVFGHITAGLDVLDKIISHGVYGGGQDGLPAQRVFIKTLKVDVS